MSLARSSPGSAFGLWLRALRTSRQLPIRAVAAAAEMDQTLVSKIELGLRWPTDEQLAAFSKFFGVDEGEIQRRLLAARFWKNIGEDDPELAMAVATQVHEDAAAYVVNNPVNKLRTRK